MLKQSQPFTRCLRLTEASQYQQVFRTARRVSDLALIVLFIPNSQKHARLGLAISKKHIHKAVNRNRIKRLIRESFRCSQHQIPDCDLVVMCRPAAGKMRNNELRRRFATLRQAIKIT